MRDDTRTVFIVEARELLADMEAALLRCEDGTADAETINAIFRAAHTIKGSAGLVGLDAVVAFTHLVETLLARVRADKLQLDAGTATVLIGCKDHLLGLIDAAALGQDVQTSEQEEAARTLTAELRVLLGDDEPAAPHLLPAPVDALTGAAHAPAISRAATGPVSETLSWHISARFSPGVLRDGMDPISFVRYLGTFGCLASVLVVDDAIPPSNEFDSEACYIGFEIRFDTTADKSKIEGAFEFFRDSCLLHIIPPQSALSHYVELLCNAPEGNMALGELLIKSGTLTQRELDGALRLQQGLASSIEGAPQLGEILIQNQLVAPRVMEAALARQSRSGRNVLHPAAPAKQESQSIRVDSLKLERLTDLIGELIIAGASTDLIARVSNLTDLTESTFRLARLVEAVRDQTLELRMVQIGGTFMRFQRVVRDVARELGKEIRLEISGGETELDKTLVEQMNDPLMHLVRNAIDHGIEDAGTRVAAGKMPQGTLRLAAYHDAGSVIIDVIDDGRGMSRARILSKALERGLIDATAGLADDRILALVFEPGFSTTDAVTELSGRGVGMDVVKSNVTALRGTVELISEEGQGTTVRIRLPLTLAIIEGFQVRVGDASFIIPLDMVEECVDLAKEHVSGANQFINLRGKLLPFVRLRDLYGIQTGAGAHESILVVRGIGLVVDELLGELQTVIKPLPRLFGHVPGIGGSTILGNGRVALILDIPGLVAQCLLERPPAAKVRQMPASASASTA